VSWPMRSTRSPQADFSLRRNSRAFARRRLCNAPN